MPASFLARHRTICAVLEEIRAVANDVSRTEYQRSEKINELCNEARDYAQRMSAKLTEYKKEEQSK